MSRWIDADALIMALRLEYPMMPMFKENQKEWEIKTDGYRKAEEVIDDALTIDIVRCKECKWHDTCCRNIYEDWRDATPTDIEYCSHGEREGE